ncbi:MAG: site-specific integrase [Acidimicrobiales bacterium]
MATSRVRRRGAGGLGAVEPAVAAALRLAATTGARRSELAALRWDDPLGESLMIDSSLAIIGHGSPSERLVPTLRDDPTKTANRRTVTLDRTTLRQLDEPKRLQGAHGPWMPACGDRPVNPERITTWWRRARALAGVAKRWCLN